MADEENNGWQLTESDPGVFSHFLKTLGVPLIVDDLYSLDDETIAALKPVHALIFLFKWVEGADESGGGSGAFDEDFTGFFAKQVVNNACATLAVLNALGNIPDLPMGDELNNLIQFSAGMDPHTLGEVIISSDFIRSAHNSLSPPPAVSLDGLALPRTSEDAYHFVVYLPIAGSLYELDGLKRAPVRHGSVGSGDSWISIAREVIERRIGTYPPGSLHFNLQALRKDPLPELQAQLDQYTRAGSEALAAEIVNKITEENEKRSRWNFENSLRRHNHVGLIHALLLALAKQGSLDAVTQSARDKMKVRREKAQAEGKMDED